MIKSIFDETFDAGFAAGEARGATKWKAEQSKGTLLKILRARFKRVPRDVENTISKMTDPVALDSWAVHAATCESMNEFATASGRTFRLKSGNVTLLQGQSIRQLQ